MGNSSSSSASDGTAGGGEEAHLPHPRNLPPVFYEAEGEAVLLEQLRKALLGLPPMDKETMSGRCFPQTRQMEKFMKEEVGMENIPQQYFVQGVKAFALQQPLEKMDPERVLCFRQEPTRSLPGANQELQQDEERVFMMTVGEVLQWQDSFTVFVASDVYSDDEEGRELISRSLSGLSEAGAEAWKMKFCIRISRCPILLNFDGIVHNRRIFNDGTVKSNASKKKTKHKTKKKHQKKKEGHKESDKEKQREEKGNENEEKDSHATEEEEEEEEEKEKEKENHKSRTENGVVVESQGIRENGTRDGKELFRYRIDENMVVEETSNSNNIFLVSVCGMDFAGREHDVMDIKRYIKNWDKVFGTLDGELVPPNGRDFAPTGEKAILHQTLLLEDLIKMARLRLQAQDRLGIQIAGEVGLGLGVFAGDMIGIGDQVRRLSVKALRRVLEKEGSFFKNIKAVICCMPVFKPRDNYHYFVEGFKGYKGVLPVWILDQDMHSVTRTAAKFFKTSELNPADSHGVFGEYWQNRGPGTEEKLALTTVGLLVQHHAVNGRVVLNPECYHFIDVAKPLND